MSFKDLSPLQLKIIHFFWRQNMNSPLHKVAQEMNISKKTIYRNFPSKKNLIENTIRYAVFKFDEGLSAITAKNETPSNQLKSMTYYWLDCIMHKCSSTQEYHTKFKVQHLRLQKKYRATMVNAVVNNLKSGELNGIYKVSNFELIGRFYIMDLSYLEENWIDDEKRRKQWLDSLIEYHLQSVHNYD